MPDSQLGNSDFGEYRNLILDTMKRLEANAERNRERSEQVQEAIKQAIVEVKLQVAKEISDLKQALNSEIKGQISEFEERLRPLELRMSSLYAAASGFGVAGGVIIWLAQMLFNKFSGN